MVSKHLPLITITVMDDLCDYFFDCWTKTVNRLVGLYVIRINCCINYMVSLHKVAILLCGGFVYPYLSVIMSYSSLSVLIYELSFVVK